MEQQPKMRHLYDGLEQREAPGLLQSNETEPVSPPAMPYMQMLYSSLQGLGMLCESAIASAVKALREQNVEDAASAVRLEEEIDRKEYEIEQLCLQMLSQRPEDDDIRRIAAALRMITDMERIGDQAADIAGIAMEGNITREDDLAVIQTMSLAAIGMVTDCVNAYLQQDLELARKVVANDNLLDSLFSEARGDLADMLPACFERAEGVLDMLLIAKYLERIGDHAVNVAQWMVYSVTGWHEQEEAEELEV